MDRITGRKAGNERRGQTRIYCDCQALVKGRDLQGNHFEEQARVLNLSASGVFLLVGRMLKTGVPLNISIPLPIGASEMNAASQLLTEGMVVREEPRENGETGVAVHFRKYRFVQVGSNELGLA